MMVDALSHNRISIVKSAGRQHLAGNDEPAMMALFESALR